MSEEVSILAQSWQVSLRAKHRSPNTIYSYLLSVRLMDEFLATPVPEIRREHVESFIAHQIVTNSPGTAVVRYKALLQFFRWLLEEGEIDANPMALMTPPAVPNVPVPVVDDDTLRRLLAACDGRAFDERRDTAIIRLFIDTPCRLSEVTLRDVEDFDLDACEVRVVVKGGDTASKPFTTNTLLAIDRYLRVRVRHKYASSTRMWLGPKGPMTPSGVRQMFERRCRMAGIPRIHPHQTRHTFAHDWKMRGGSDENLMRLAGWKSPAMLRKYGDSAAEERAKEAYRKMNPGERI